MNPSVNVAHFKAGRAPVSQTWFPLQTADEDHMWLDFPLSVLWQRRGGIYLSSAVGSVAGGTSLEPNYYFPEIPTSAS